MYESLSMTGTGEKSGRNQRTRGRGSPRSRRKSRYAGTFRRAFSNASHARQRPTCQRNDSNPGKNRSRYVRSLRVTAKRSSRSTVRIEKTIRRWIASVNDQLPRLEPLAPRRLGAVAEARDQPRRPTRLVPADSLVKRGVRALVGDDRAERVQHDAVLRQEEPRAAEQPAGGDPVGVLVERAVEPGDRRGAAHRPEVEAAHPVAEARQLEERREPEVRVQERPRKPERARREAVASLGGGTLAEAKPRADLPPRAGLEQVIEERVAVQAENEVDEVALGVRGEAVARTGRYGVELVEGVRRHGPPVVGQA